MVRNIRYTLALLLLVVPLVVACGGDDDDVDATPGAGGTTTTSSAVATGTTDSAAVGTATTSTEATAEATTAGTTPTTGDSTTATTEADGTATEEGTEEATAEGTAEGTEEATEEATEDATGTQSGNSTPQAGDMTADEERLMDLLLTEDEALAILGEDWTETSRDPVEDDEGDSVGICGAVEFPRRDEKIAHVEANWEAATGGAFENIVDFPDDVVVEAMDYVRDSLDCTEWETEDGSTAAVATWDNPDLADLGDDVVAIIVTTEVSGVPVDLHVAFVQTGHLITQFMYGSATADAATAEQTAVDLITAGVEKVEAGM